MSDESDRVTLAEKTDAARNLWREHCALQRRCAETVARYYPLITYKARVNWTAQGWIQAHNEIDIIRLCLVRPDTFDKPAEIIADIERLVAEDAVRRLDGCTKQVS